MEVIATVARLRKYLQGVPGVCLHHGQPARRPPPSGRGSRHGACTRWSACFVNRLQFGPREDFDRRDTLADDCRKRKASIATWSSRPTRLYPGRQTCRATGGYRRHP